MVERLALRAPQPPMIKFIRDVKRCGLFAGMGIGKTSGVLMALITMRIMGELDPRYPVLVIGPARVARDTWADEVAKWAQFKDLTIIPLSGDPVTRLKKLRMPADIFTVSYELLPWLVEFWLDKWPYRVVIADELDRLKGFREKRGGTDIQSAKSGSSGERSFALGRVAHNFTDRWINLGGTPAPAGLKDLWGSTWFLDRGARLGSTYTTFKKRWFMRRWSGTGIEPLPFADKQIYAALSDICLTIDPKDYFDLREIRVNTVTVKLPDKAKALYNRLKNDLYVVLESGVQIDALTAAGLTNKCMQMANGAMYTEHPAWEKTHDAKIEALESIVSESGGMPLLVQYAFKADKARILNQFRNSVDISTPRGLAAFKAGEFAIGVAHPESMGHGIDGLQHVTSQLVQFGHIWKSGAVQQFIERIGPMRQLQAGLNRQVTIHRIVAQGTIDLDIIKANKNDWTIQDFFLDAMKRSP
jgi:hypothetical protein